MNQQTTPPSSSYPPTHDHHHEEAHHSQLAGIIAFGFLLLIIVGVGAFYLGTRSVTPAPQSTLTYPTVSPTPDETANWKTYSNMQNKYSIKYPQDWVYQIGENGQVEFFTQFSPYEDTPQAIILMVSSPAKQPLITGDEKNRLITKTAIVIGGIRGEQGDLEEAETKTKYKQSAIAYENKGYYFTLRQLEFLKIYNQMLSTFTFTK